MHSVSILTIGSEVLDGRVQDTNSNFLCKKLALLGLEVSHILSCTDIISDIKDVLKFAFARTNIVIITGGLGPTTDDLTRESVAEFFSKKLVLSVEALNEMKALYQKRGRNFNPTNEKQALFPEDSKIIPNPVGTAPGFMMNEDGMMLASLPGVPVEMIAMYQDTVEPFLKGLDGIMPLNVKGFKCFSLPEAAIGAKIQELNIPEEIFVSYRAAFPEVHIALKSHSKEIDKYFEKTKQAIGAEFIFTENLNLSFEEYILNLLAEKKLTLTTAESCTGGMLASFLTNVPGSSKSFLGSIVSYANSVKIETLGISKELIDTHGAVSFEVAKAMAENCRIKLNSNIAVSITGIAGPDGRSPEKPVGLYYVGLSTKEGCSSHRHFLRMKRKQIRAYASHMALDIIRRHLLNIPQLPDAVIPEAK